MTYHRRVIAIVTLIGLAPLGCFHARVETGFTPSGKVVGTNWAPGFLWGLVAPHTYHTAKLCPYGAAIVDTQVGFGNYIAAGLTLGLYTPMTIKVSCASSGEAGAATISGSPDVAIAAGAQASLETGLPVVVRITGQSPALEADIPTSTSPEGSR